MLESTGNLWDQNPGTVVVITTNGDIKQNGACVMGRGCAKEARDSFPGIDLKLGSYIAQHGNRPFKLGTWTAGEGDTETTYTIVSFPVKHHWRDKADIELIVDSAKKLSAMADKFGWESVVIPRPGCGNGQLVWDCDHGLDFDHKCISVREHITGILDDRFTVITFKE